MVVAYCRIDGIVFSLLIVGQFLPLVAALYLLQRRNALNRSKQRRFVKLNILGK